MHLNHGNICTSRFSCTHNHDASLGSLETTLIEDTDSQKIDIVDENSVLRNNPTKPSENPFSSPFKILDHHETDYFSCFLFLIIDLLTGTEGLCRPCDPTDPLAHNPETYAHDSPPSINNSTFIEGNGRHNNAAHHSTSSWHCDPKAFWFLDKYTNNF